VFTEAGNELWERMSEERTGVGIRGEDRVREKEKTKN
jgi:hypothetical protein